jgi:hypothetical protein
MSAQAGDTLTSDTAELNMICTDLEGDRVVIDGLPDHKHAEVGVWSNGSFGFWGDRIRYDELTFAGEMHTPPGAKPGM